MNKARLPSPVDSWLENIRMLEGNCQELKAQPSPQLMRTHIDSPHHFSFGLNQPHGIGTQVRGWQNMVTSLRSMTLETRAGPKAEQILGVGNRELIY